jgi:hypothetical protein
MFIELLWVSMSCTDDDPEQEQDDDEQEDPTSRENTISELKKFSSSVGKVLANTHL